MPLAGPVSEDRMNVHLAVLSPTVKLGLRGLSSVNRSQLISSPHSQISLTLAIKAQVTGLKPVWV